MLHPNIQLQFINESVGFGLIASQLIPRGTVTWVHDKFDVVITGQEMEHIEEIYKRTIIKYAYRNKHGDFIFSWDNGRFINHSFDSNTISTAYNFDIAIRDIAAGEEITCDYGCFNLPGIVNLLPENSAQRTAITPHDIILYHQIFDKKASQGLAYFDKVEQALKPIIDHEVYQKCVDIAQNKAQIDSILTCYFEEKNEVPIYRYH
ncbi:MAG: SET domain-containing protein-lysine N-methyltransferase [Nostocales cyanobacterium]|nr:MAG: SET domain-containing protein-lysine N-methyltransferase [Nostocales cyanobacterium]